MPFTPSFTVSQTVDGNSFSLEDTSTGGVDIAVVGRRIYLQEEDGTYLTYSSPPNYIEWNIADSEITLTDILPVSMSLSITVDWVDSGGNALYHVTQSYCLEELNETFMYGLVQNIAANRGVMQDTNFMFNCFEIDMLTEYAIKAVVTGNDIASSQQLLDFAQVMINDEEMFFGFSNSN